MPSQSASESVNLPPTFHKDNRDIMSNKDDGGGNEESGSNFPKEAPTGPNDIDDDVDDIGEATIKFGRKSITAREEVSPVDHSTRFASRFTSEYTVTPLVRAPISKGKNSTAESLPKAPAGSKDDAVDRIIYSNDAEKTSNTNEKINAEMTNNGNDDDEECRADSPPGGLLFTGDQTPKEQNTVSPLKFFTGRDIGNRDNDDDSTLESSTGKIIAGTNSKPIDKERIWNDTSEHTNEEEIVAQPPPADEKKSGENIESDKEKFFDSLLTHLTIKNEDGIWKKKSNDIDWEIVTNVIVEIPPETAIHIGNLKDELHGFTLLHWVVEIDVTAGAIKPLLQACPELAKEKDKMGMTPFHRAVLCIAPLDVIKLFLEACPEAAKEKDRHGWAPLHWLVQNGATADVIKLLLDKYPEAAKEKTYIKQTPLHLAAEKGAPADVIKLLLEANIEAAQNKDNNNKTPLYLAVERDPMATADVIKLLIDAYPEAAKGKNYCKETPIHLAAKKGASADIIKLLLDAYPEAANQKGSDNSTPLHRAAERKGVTATEIKLLLEACPEAAKEMNYRDRGYTKKKLPLHLAAQRGASSDVIKLLLEAYPEAAKAKDSDKMSPLHWAVDQKNASTDVIKVLLEACPESAYNKDNNNKTPLHVAVERKPSADVIKLLLEAYPEASKEKDYCKETPLHSAAKKGASTEVINVLLEAYPEAANEKDNYNKIPLHWAVECGATDDLVKVLLEACPEAAKAKDNQQRTPLHVAVQEGASPGVIKLLLEKYKNAAKENDYSKKTHLQKAVEMGTPLHWAVERGATDDLVKVLLEACPEATKIKGYRGRTPLHWAAEKGATAGVTNLILMKYKDAAKEEDYDKKTPLDWATEKGAALDVIRVLLEASPESYKGRTPLHVAAENGATADAIRLLLKKYKNAAREKDYEKKTPLHWAIEKAASDDIIKLFLEAYPEAVKEKDINDTTPLHMSVGHSAPADVIKLLLKACPEAAKKKDKYGMTPLHLAIGRGATADVVNLLLEACPSSAKEKDMYHRTPLQLAAESKDEVAHISKALLKVWKDGIKEQNGEGQVPLFAAVERKAKLRKIEFYFDKFKPAVYQKDYLGRSLFSLLIGRITKGDYNNSHDSSEAIRHGLVDDIKIIKLFLGGVRDGRELQPFVVDGNYGNRLHHFLSLMQSQQSFEQYIQNAKSNPIQLDLNYEPINGWTMLEILVDFDMEEVSDIFFQIVDQVQKINTNMKTVQILNKKTGTMTTFVLSTELLETTWRKIADRAKLLNNVPKLKKWGMEYGRLFGRYLIDKNERVRHRSETCVVVFATHLAINGKEVKVALKFMANSDYFKKEINSRQTIVKKSSENEARENVVLVNKAFSSDKGLSDSFELVEHRKYFAQEIGFYTNIKLEGSNSTTICHLLEMSCGLGDDLSDVISHQNIAGKNLIMVCHIALSIAKILQFLNETCHVVHGDVKARNFIVWRTGGQCVAIDLDNSSDITNDTDSGSKDTSSGYLPPEQAALLYAKRTAGVMINEKELAGLEEKKKQYQELLQKIDHEGMRSEFEERIQLIEDEINGATQKHDIESELKPNKACEMWRFGFLLYQLCTNSDLFYLGNQEQVFSNDVLKEIRDWNNDALQKKLGHIHDNNWGKLFKPLLEQLLQPDPKDRPKHWDDIIIPLMGGITRHDVHTLHNGIKRVEDKFDGMRRGVDRLIEFAELSSLSSPRYMLVVPLEFGIEKKLNFTALLNKRAKVVFVCPVTLIVPRDDNGKIMGYEFQFSKKWYKKLGPVLRIGLMYLNLALTVYNAGFVPFSGPLSIGMQERVGELAEVSWLKEYMRGEMPDGSINQGAANLNDPHAIHRLPKNEIKELCSSYTELMNIAQDDCNFENSGLSKAYCMSGQTAEFVMNIPEVVDLYKKEGNDSSLNPVAMKGFLTTKKEKKEKTSYYILLITGHLSRFENKEEYENNRYFGLKGKTKPRFTNIILTGDLGIEIYFFDGSKKIFQVDPPESREEWVKELEARKLQKRS